MVRQPVRLGVELAVGQWAGVANDGDGVGRACRLRREQLRQARARNGLRGGVPLLDDGVALGGIEQREAADRSVGVGERGEQPQETLPDSRRDRPRCAAPGWRRNRSAEDGHRRDRRLGSRGLRPGRAKIMGGGGLAGEIEAVVERHHVNAQPEQRAVVAPHVGELVALVRKRRAKPLAMFAPAHPQPDAGRESKPQRQHVRRHAGAAPQALASRRDRKPDHNIIGAGQAMQEDRRGRAHDAGKAGPAARRQRPQPVLA